MKPFEMFTGERPAALLTTYLGRTAAGSTPYPTPQRGSDRWLNGHSTAWRGSWHGAERWRIMFLNEEGLVGFKISQRGEYLAH